MNIGSILLTAIIASVFGLLGGAVWGLFKVWNSERKAKADYKKNKVFEVKDKPKNIKDKIVEENNEEEIKNWIKNKK